MQHASSGLAVQAIGADYCATGRRRMSTHIPDELLIAYVDGKLGEAERVRVEQAIAHDARIAQRVAQQRALRGRLRNVFDGVLRESVPQRLVNASRLDSSAGPAQIIDLARVRAERARRPERRRVPIPRRAVLAIAASLAVGLSAGFLIDRLLAGGALIEYRDGALLAGGLLDRALSEQLAGATAARSAVRIGLSFHARSGGYCRTFVLDSGLAGLACKEPRQWRVLTLVGTDAPGRAAGSPLPAPLLQAVSERTSGEPLDAASEIKARHNAWH
jgi:hypothetical protein